MDKSYEARLVLEELIGQKCDTTPFGIEMDTINIKLLKYKQES